MNGNLSLIAKTSTILLITVIFLFFFIKFLPVILIITAGAYGIYKINSLINERKKFSEVSRDEVEEAEDKYEFSEKQIIDVDYYDAEEYKK